MLEALGRLAFAYARNQYALRDKRPPLQFAIRTARFLAASLRQPLIEAEMSGLRVLVSTSDRTIGRSVYASGDWDPLLVGTVFAALDRYAAPFRGRTFLEIGANFGVYSLPAVVERGFARAIGYEPDPTSFALLLRNIARNDLGNRVIAHNVALSDKPGELVLRLGTSNAGDNRVVADDGRTAPDLVRVPARTLDDEVDAGGIALDELGLVWLDVQGHEPEVLRGAARLLESSVPVVMEFATTMLGEAGRNEMVQLIGKHFDAFVDLGWTTLTNRLVLQPASAAAQLGADGRSLETDLLLLHSPRRSAELSRG